MCSAGAASRWEPRAQRSRTPSGLIAKHDFGNSEAPLMARQQFVTHLPRIHLSRSLVSVREFIDGDGACGISGNDSTTSCIMSARSPFHSVTECRIEITRTAEAPEFDSAGHGKT